MIVVVVDVSTAVETKQLNRTHTKRTYIRKSNNATLKSKLMKINDESVIELTSLKTNNDDITLPDNIHVSAESRFSPLPSVLNEILKQESVTNNSAVTQLSQDVKCNDNNRYSSWLTNVYITLRNAGLLPFNPQTIPLETPTEIFQETPQQIIEQETTKRPKVSEIDYSSEQCPDKKSPSNTSIEWIKKFYNKLKNANLLPSKESNESNDNSISPTPTTTASSLTTKTDSEGKSFFKIWFF